MLLEFYSYESQVTTSGRVPKNLAMGSFGLVCGLQSTKEADFEASWEVLSLPASIGQAEALDSRGSETCAPTLSTGTRHQNRSLPRPLVPCFAKLMFR